MNEETFHYSSDVRERFQELLEDRDSWTTAEFTELAESLLQCGDIVPAAWCVEVDEPRGSTYGQIAKSMLAWLKVHGTNA